MYRALDRLEAFRRLRERHQAISEKSASGESLEPEAGETSSHGGVPAEGVDIVKGVQPQARVAKTGTESAFCETNPNLQAPPDP